MKYLYPLLLMVLFSCNTGEDILRIHKNRTEIKSDIVYYEDVLFTGILFENFTDGRLQNEYNYRDGIKHGEGIEYLSAQFGEGVRYRKEYKNDKPFGHWQLFYAGGQVKFEFHYNDNGIKIGEEVMYHENGQIMRQCNYVEGKRVGKLVRYDEVGTMTNKTIYDSNGEVVESIDF